MTVTTHETIPPHALFAAELSPGGAKYLPDRERAGNALCLSGGGYRATLLHLGAIRRLNELGVLGAIDEISAVSGGSVMAAQLGAALVALGGSLPADGIPAAEFDRRVALPIRAFTARNIRTGAIAARLAPWNWNDDDAGVEALARQYEHHLTPLALRELPPRPVFTFCATDMAFGTAWTFRRDAMGDEQAGYGETPLAMTIGRAVAASSCFPPVFNPLRMELDPASLSGGAYAEADRDRCVRGLRLTDGGNYDNLGLEPVWRQRAAVLVSDGGGTFEYAADRGLAWRVERYTAIIENQARALRKRWLLAGYLTQVFAGTFWGIASGTASYRDGFPGYPEAFAKTTIAKVRTDFDAFSPGEQGVLENHGYSLAEVAMKVHAPHLIRRDAAFVAPAPGLDWHHMAAAGEALRDSGRRSWLGRS